MGFIRRAGAVAAMALLLAALAGCMSAAPAEDLYCLPLLADEYLSLQQLLDAEVAAGSDYAAPGAGNYRQSVQQCDLNGDGVNEALAFFRDSARLAKICVYTPNEDGEYVLALTIGGQSSDLGRVEYTDLDGNGTTELLAAWQIGSGMSLLKAYSFEGLATSEILTADSAEFRVYDLNADGRDELFILSFDSAAGSHIDMYSFGPRGAEIVGAGLSEGLLSVDRIRMGSLSDGKLGLFVEGAYSGGGIITDILAVSGGRLVNITLDPGGGRSGTLRQAVVYTSDIDDDGVGEVPDSVTVRGADEEEAVFFDWYVFDSAGSRARKLSTYHCYEDGWYLTLTDELRNGSALRRVRTRAGEISVVFYRYDAASGESEDLLAIYTLTGDNRYVWAQTGDRLLLRDSGSTVYAGELLGCTMTEEDLRMLFNIIYAEWITGEL